MDTDHVQTDVKPGTTVAPICISPPMTLGRNKSHVLRMAVQLRTEGRLFRRGDEELETVLKGGVWAVSLTWLRRNNFLAGVD